MNISFETKIAAIAEAEKNDRYHRVEHCIIRLDLEIERAELDFREMQERYDRFVERHYDERYERWYEQVSERYRRRIRRLFFRIRGTEKKREEYLTELGSWSYCPLEDNYLDYIDWDYIDSWS